MEDILIYLLKSAGVLSIFVLLYHFLLRRLTFFKANRWFLLFGMIASIGFPLIEITQTVYVEQPEVFYVPQQTATPMTYLAPEPVVEPFIDLNQMLFLVYASISLFFIGKMAVELLSLRRLIKSGSRRMEDGFVRISLSRKVTPFSFFNYICFYEKEEKSAASDLILKHEQVHAREWHSVDLLLTHVYCAIFWMNPLAWLLKRQIGENLEFIADATAKVQNTTGISYERTLLSSAASHMQPALANNFFTPFIKKRIQMLQKETSKTWNAYKYALILPVILLFLYSFNVVDKIEYIKANKETVKNSNKSELYVFDTDMDQMHYTETMAKINITRNYKVVMLPPTNNSSSFSLLVAFDNQSEIFKVNIPISSRNVGGTFLEAFDNSLIVCDKDFNKMFVIDRDGIISNVMEKALTFNIDAKTTTAELDSYRNQINKYANYIIKLERKVEEGSPMTFIAVDFDKLKGEGSITSYPQEMDIQLSVEKNILSIINEKSGSIIHASKDGIRYESITKEFAISSKTSQTDLNVYVDQINDFSNFKIKLEKAKAENGTIQLSVSTAFGNKDFDKKVVLPLSDKSLGLILLRVSKNKLKINDDSSNDTYSIDKGTSLKMSKEDWTYDAKEAKATKASLKNEKIEFKIPPTTTQESLEKIKKSLKSEYNVDLKISNLKYKDGKIISINIQLDDNRGFKGSQSYTNDTAIPTICITGIIDEERKNWSMGNCRETTYSVNSVSFFNDLPEKSRAIIDSIYVSRKGFNSMELDSLQWSLKKVQSALSEFSNDKISKQLKARLLEAEKRLSKMNLDSMMFGDPNVTYLLGNVSYSDKDSIIANAKAIWAYQSKSDNRNFDGSNPPLIIVNGEEMTKEELGRLDSFNIESMNILKDNAATSLYGSKGKNGVVLITTKTNKKIKNPPLYFIDGKETSEKDFEIMDVYRFKSVSVLKEDQAISKYGDRAKYGVIKVELKTDAEMKKQPVNSNDVEEVIVTGYSIATSTSIDTFTITIDDFTDTELAELKSTLKNLDHDFELKTFRKNGEKVSKLKFDLDGTTYTYQPKNGIKSLTIKKEGKGEDPKVSAVTF